MGRGSQRDADIPDPWDEVRRKQAILTGANDADVENTPFDSAERAEIAKQLQEIKEYVRSTYALSEAQMLSIEEKLDEIKSAAGRVGRRDWREVFRGVMLSVIANGLLPPDAVQHILSMALLGLDHLFGGGGQSQLL